MKHRFQHLLPLATIAIVFTLAAAVSAQMVGGYRSIAKTDETVLSAATFAVAAQADKTQSEIELLDVIKAESQLVAGMNYRLCLEVSAGAGPSYVQAVVYVDLKRNPRLTSWTASNCGKAVVAAPVIVPVTGGYKTVAKSDPDVIAAARFAIEAQSEKTDIEYVLKYIKAAERQVVQGTNYRLCMRVSGDGEASVFVQAVVYYDLRRNYRLTRWVETNCGGV